jgi:hypothetical protein
LDTIDLSIETAQRNQHKNASKDLEKVQEYLRSLITLLNNSERLPSYFPNRETIDTDISIIDACCQELIQRFKDVEPPQNIQDGFSELKKSFNKIKKEMSETN